MSFESLKGAWELFEDESFSSRMLPAALLFIFLAVSVKVFDDAIYSFRDDFQDCYFRIAC